MNRKSIKGASFQKLSFQKICKGIYGLNSRVYTLADRQTAKQKSTMTDLTGCKQVSGKLLDIEMKLIRYCQYSDDSYAKLKFHKL